MAEERTYPTRPPVRVIDHLSEEVGQGIIVGSLVEINTAPTDEPAVWLMELDEHIEIGNVDYFLVL
jgi:hypothetical protein